MTICTLGRTRHLASQPLFSRPQSLTSNRVCPGRRVAGTGRALQEIKRLCPDVFSMGIEPSAELRERGHLKGLSPTELLDGDAERLNFHNGEVDLVCAFSVLHHVPRPGVVVAEMLRVAKKAVFISD